MNVNANSWHYKMYEYSYYLGGDPPKVTNLCHYTRRAVAAIPLFILIALAIMVAMSGMVFTMAVLFIPALIFGYYPNLKFFASGFSTSMFKDYNGFMFKGREWYPWHFLLLPFLFFLEYEWVTHFNALYPLIINGIIMIGLLTVSFYIWIKNPKSETAGLIKTNLQAKKSLVCPIVTFTNLPTSMDINEDSEEDYSDMYSEDE